ncbi:beta strand repeat-containing protein [Sphingomonas sp. PAMC 26621]|uniref:beta strand repeat-containing protein n=1 Tax=Sphingomonas sp. PAMC 26621 TaxID=1112213 RepID=UPI000288D8B6|nr:outer membrane autotransporter [Sphingomonas sp. PAMC 26621]
MSANLAFASGALLLNDTIMAANIAPSAITISNGGADITLPTIVSIVANYRQTAGSLLLGSAGRLVVTQSATFSGGTIGVDVGGLNANATYRVGDAVGGTLVAGGLGSSYAGVSIAATGGIAGLSFAGKTSATNLILGAKNIYVGDTQTSVGNTGTISGVSYALYVANTGAVGTLGNSGILSGTADGVSINGSIGTLTNSGRISGAQKGLGNQATIGTLINAAGGTILGGTAAGLQNDTTLGRLINAGVISSGSAGFANYGVMGSLINSGTITGGVQGIYNAGTISATLANSGSITSAQSAIGLSGGIATLVNSGVIGGGSTGINLAGTLGTLVNLAGGTISASDALYVDGTLGGLDNSGLIRGNIKIVSANPLTISGGAAGTIGTLTGLSGRATITNTLGNIVFASGNLLLDDNIVATGRTISNTGANLTLNTLVNVTGKYSQSAGTLTIDPTLGGLAVNGAVVLGGGTVRSSLSSTGNYLQSTYTLISASSLAIDGAQISINSIAGLYDTTSAAGKLLLSITNDYVGGTLATLSNSATITAAATGLYVVSGGSIGTLTNTGTFGGNQFGITNRGAIATLSNAGLITSTNLAAFANAGSIGRIVNAGTISNASRSLLNTGTIGTVTNSGVIGGGVAAIQNGGLLTLIDNRGTMSGSGDVISGNVATIVNSGLIRGNINPEGGSIGTIVGGSGGTVGTFTGFDGTSQGTFGASADLFFASGRLLFNDKILAVGALPANLTISNVGADIVLSSVIQIDGNYRQTAGILDLGANGGLLVTQGAALTGGTIAASLGDFSATSTYLVGGGAARTLVVGGTGSNYAGVNAVLSGGFSGLRVNATTSGTNYVLAVGNDYIGTSQDSIGNSGTIGGATYALYVADSASVGTLVNSGTLSGTATGLVNRGSIGTLSNNGLIDGTIGLRNYGIITAFANAGTVAANGVPNGIGVFSTNLIANFTNDGVISGGTGGGSTGILVAGTIGTLSNHAGATIGQAAEFGTGVQNYGTIGRVANAGFLTAGRNGFANGGTVGWFDNRGTVSTSDPSFYTALLNTGSIGTLTNSGRIAASAGIYNSSGSIAFLINQQDGVIAGQNAIFSTGSIGMLSNSGTILSSGGGNAVSVLGTLGTLVNTGSIISDAGLALIVTGEGWLGGIANGGVIRGDIYNFGSHALTISAGVGPGTGTFTGIAGGHGLIINAASDLVFSSGSLLLGDDIELNGLHTAINAGATLSLVPGLSIHGDFTQTDGVLSLVPGQQALSVIGTVNLTGGTVRADLTSTGNYLAGDSLLLISGWAGSRYDGATLAGAPTGLDAVADGSEGSLVERFANSYVGGALETLSNTGTVSAATAVYIAATGSLGRLANSGVIAGDILNLSTNGLTISGGLNDTQGTLTGRSGQGRITSTGSNVVFDTGSLLLDDSVDVGAGALINSGASVALNGVVSVTGAFTQTDGTLSFARGTGRLVASGAAILGGGTVAMTGFAPTGNYLVGDLGGVVVEGGEGSSSPASPMFQTSVACCCRAVRRATRCTSISPIIMSAGRWDRSPTRAISRYRSLPSLHRAARSARSPIAGALRDRSDSSIWARSTRSRTPASSTSARPESSTRTGSECSPTAACCARQDRRRSTMTERSRRS